MIPNTIRKQIPPNVWALPDVQNELRLVLDRHNKAVAQYLKAKEQRNAN